MAENAFRWLDDEVNFTKRTAVREMVEVIPQVNGKFRNLHPRRVEDAVKAHQVEMFERTI